MTGDGVSLKHHVYAIAGLMAAGFLLLMREKDKALTTALESNDKRLDGMNEFRASLNDMASRFVTRAEADAQRARATATTIAIVGLLVTAAALLIPLSR